MNAHAQPPYEATQQVRDRWRGAILCSALVFCAAAFSFRFTSFLHAKEAVLALALVALGFLGVHQKTFPREGLLAFLPLWGLIAYSLLVHGVFGAAHTPSYTVAEALRIAALLLFAAFAYDLTGRAAWRERITGAVVVSALLVAGLGYVQYVQVLPGLFPLFPDYDQRIYSVFGNQDLFGGYIAIALPLAAGKALRGEGRGPRALAALFMLLPALLLSGSRTAWLAAAVGAAVVFPYGQLKEKRILALAGGLAVLVVATCFAAPEATVGRVQKTFGADDVGSRARLWFWDATLRMMRDAPVTGVGLGNYPYWSPFNQGAALHAPGRERHYHNELHTLHAHSDPLEIAGETGLIGACFLVWMAWRMRKTRGREWGALAALLTFSLFNATYQSAPHALCALLLMAMLMAREEPSAHAVSAYGGYAMGAVSLALAAAAFVTVLWPSVQLTSARDAIEEGRDAEGPYRILADSRWPNYLAKLELGILLKKKGEFARAEEWALAARAGLDTGEIHYLLGLLAAQRGDFQTAREELEVCLWRWPSHLGAWEVLMAILPPDEQEERLTEAQRWLSAGDLAVLRR